ncbi:cytosolic iron-sulfur protein assembly protein 1 [Nannizzia gypsea CBS 118893]|uniref:Probable cytosolic iron-sulfur protein assembly protein 1 n=1 Tax=Arthroderma gypseum (strain ATCC MYA-4604 / CBS 118893) TaxID=535722 RepID=E5QZ48_ARTGP|nr:cytosolic iron-sulfur protein assembly protein 1 [Nannizzia gypsea CBS 118893]EFQ98957.1 cytosolic iron-sulfur protein assembly protein 1 [Nannizzia gypsea CBS 118893]
MTSKISHLADLTPAPQERLWHSCPHPRFPIVATCGADKIIRIYSLLNFTLLSSISGGHKRSVRCSAWKPNSGEEIVLATASFDATVGIWKRWEQFQPTSTQDPEVDDGGKDILCATGDESEEDKDDWTFAVVLDGHDSEVKAVSWSSSGSLLATCSRDKSIWIWEDLEDGDSNFETIAVLQDHQGDVKCVSWHPEEDRLASGGYDNTVRLWKEDIDDWNQVACLIGHEGTVWSVDWEAPAPSGTDTNDEPDVSTAQRIEGELRPGTDTNRREPRLASCSDDRTIRIWKKVSDPAISTPQNVHHSIPGTIRTNTTEETWVQESVLPKEHDMSIYSVAWSKATGLLASAGADGKIVIYQERQKLNHHVNVDLGEDAVESKRDTHFTDKQQELDNRSMEREWCVLSTMEAAHGVNEINHICWATRGPRREDQITQKEMLLTTGDNGIVKAWTVSMD